MIRIITWVTIIFTMVPTVYVQIWPLTTNFLFGTFAPGIFINSFIRSHFWIIVFLLLIMNSYVVIYELCINLRYRIYTISSILLVISVLFISFGSKAFYIDVYDYFNNKLTKTSKIRYLEIVRNNGIRITTDTYRIILDNNEKFNVNAFLSVIDEDTVGKTVSIEYLQHSKRIVDLYIKN